VRLSLQVWDLRMDPSSCIKTLSSSGLTTNGAVVVATSTTGGRSLAPLPPGETQINDIGLTPSGYGLFSAAADKVRCFSAQKTAREYLIKKSKQCSGSGSVGSMCFWALRIRSQMSGFGSGSGSFQHQAKIVKKNLYFFCFVTSL
jgi:hypothetical protein